MHMLIILVTIKQHLVNNLVMVKQQLLQHIKTIFAPEKQFQQTTV